MRAPVGALGGGRWGAFSESAEGGVAGSEIQPYRERAGVGCGRLGDRSLSGGRRVRWGWTERTRSLPGGGRPRWAAKAGSGGRLGDPALP